MTSRLPDGTGSSPINGTECPVKRAHTAKSTGKADVRYGKIRVCQQTHRVFRADLPEIIAVGTAKALLKDMGDVVLAVAKYIGKLRQADFLGKMLIEIIGNILTDAARDTFLPDKRHL